jgi:hypothetical protein
MCDFAILAENRHRAIKKGWQYCHPFFLAEYVCRLSNDVNFSTLETDCAVGGGKQCEVSAHTHIKAGEEFRTALADDY